MDDKNAGAEQSAGDLTSRPPLEEDLVKLCRELNRREARYVVVGGLAIIAAGLPRTTGDVDLMVARDSDNETRVFSALSTLPDNAVRELRPGELQQYNVIRVADEILVALMCQAGGIDYEEAAKNVVAREIAGVLIPFATPQLLWRMKSRTYRAKDEQDLIFLKKWFAERGEEPPQV